MAIVALLAIYWSVDSLIIWVAILSSFSVIMVSFLFLIDRVGFTKLSEDLFSRTLYIFSALFIYHASIASVLAAYKFLNEGIFMIKLVVYILFNLIIALIFYSYKSKPKHE